MIGNLGQKFVMDFAKMFFKSSSGGYGLFWGCFLKLCASTNRPVSTATFSLPRSIKSLKL